MNKSLMLKEIKEHLGIKKEIEFAEYLDVKPGTLAAWHSRNTFDAELLIAKCRFLNPRWLLTGEGSMVIEEPNERQDQREDNSYLLIREKERLLEEKERAIELLLKQAENYSQSDIPDLKRKIAALESKLELMLSIVKIDDRLIQTSVIEKTKPASDD